MSRILQCDTTTGLTKNKNGETNQIRVVEKMPCSRKYYIVPTREPRTKRRSIEKGICCFSNTYRHLDLA